MSMILGQNLNRQERKKAVIKYFHKRDAAGEFKVHTKTGERIPEKNAVSLTKQSLSADANINNIVSKYHKTGVLGNPNFTSNIQPMFVDLTTAPSFQEAHNRIAAAQSAFESLPSDLRAKFDNDPQKLLDFYQNDANLEECYELGLKVRPVPEPKVQAAPEPTPDPEAS